MKSAIYVRVSTLEQAQEGYSLAAQEEKLKNYASFQKYETLPSYIDDGYSAASTNRPALIRLIDDVKCGRINIVLIYKLDRLSRRVKDVLELVELFEQYNVALYSLTENLDLSSPFGRAALKMSATFSELERETIIERTKLGRDQKIKQGKMMLTRIAPFGYDYNLKTKKFEIIPEQAEMVRKLFDLYINGMPFRKLYEYAKENFQHPHFTNPMSCKPIIRRIMYAGYISYKGEIYKGTNFEPIIEYDTFLKAQKQIDKNRTTRTRDCSPYLLTGLLVCVQCGNRYVGKLYDRYNIKKDGTETKRYKYTAYGCAARVKRDKNYQPAKCENIIFPTADLENIVNNAVVNFKFNNFISDFSESTIVDSLMSENATAKKQINKLLDLYMSELIDKDTYQLRAAEYEKTIRKNKEIIEQESNKLSDRPTKTIDYLLEKQKEYNSLSKQERRKFLSLIIDRIAIDNEKVNIKWRVMWDKSKK